MYFSQRFVTYGFVNTCQIIITRREMEWSEEIRITDVNLYVGKYIRSLPIVVCNYIVSYNHAHMFPYQINCTSRIS